MTVQSTTLKGLDFLVEIDRGTMPISRSDFRQSSFQRKMLAYLAAHAANLHETILNRDQLVEVIACGRPGTEMPRFDKYARWVVRAREDLRPVLQRNCAEMLGQSAERLAPQWIDRNAS